MGLGAAAAVLAALGTLAVQRRAAGIVPRLEPFGAYAAARYEDVRTLYKDAQRFSSEALAVTAEPPWLGLNPVAQSLVTKDPPRHTQLRALVNRAFGAAGMARLEAQVRQEAEALAEAAVRQREVDFVDAFSFVLPRNIIGRMLGLEPSTFTEFKRWSVNMGFISSAVPSQHQGIRDAVKEMEAYLGDSPPPRNPAALAGHPVAPRPHHPRAPGPPRGPHSRRGVTAAGETTEAPPAAPRPREPTRRIYPLTFPLSASCLYERGARAPTDERGHHESTSPGPAGRR